MARVVKVLWAATKKRWSRKARRPALSSFDGPVNLPPDMEPGFSAPGMRKAASYQWLQDAVADAQADPQGTLADPVNLALLDFSIAVTTAACMTAG